MMNLVLNRLRDLELELGESDAQLLKIAFDLFKWIAGKTGTKLDDAFLAAAEPYVTRACSAAGIDAETTDRVIQGMKPERIQGPDEEDDGLGL